jgi:hypothetical protein
MSHEITNQVTELSADELDVVAGGGSGLFETADFNAESNVLNSLFTNGVDGTKSLTQISQQKVSSSASKSAFVF